MEAAHLVYRHFMPTIYEAVREFARDVKGQMEPKLERSWKIQNTIENEDDPNDKGVEVWSETWPHRGNRWWVKWQYKKGYFEYGLLNPGRKGRVGITSRLDESAVRPKYSQRDAWWAFYKYMDIVPNLEDDMTALQRLLDEHERRELAKQVGDEVLEFVYACDRAFKPTS